MQLYSHPNMLLRHEKVCGQSLSHISTDMIIQHIDNNTTHHIETREDRWETSTGKLLF